MKTVIIKDLALACELDHNAMVGVRGGYNASQAPWFPSPAVKKVSSSLDATQGLVQLQNVVNPTANGSAFVDCVDANNHTEQYGQNNILVG